MTAPRFRFQAFSESLSRTATKQDYTSRAATNDTIPVVATWLPQAVGAGPLFNATSYDNDVVMRLARNNQVMNGWFSVRLGAAFSGGVNAPWQMVLPARCLYANPTTPGSLRPYVPIGRWRAEQASSTRVAYGDIICWDAQWCRFVLTYNNGLVDNVDNYITSLAPWTWAANDRFAGQFSYPVYFGS